MTHTRNRITLKRSNPIERYRVALYMSSLANATWLGAKCRRLRRTARYVHHTEQHETCEQSVSNIAERERWTNARGLRVPVPTGDITQQIHISIS